MVEIGKLVTCDICGRRISKRDTRYKFKKYSQGSYRRDMCDYCYREFCDFVSTKKLRRENK